MTAERIRYPSGRGWVTAVQLAALLSAIGPSAGVSQVAVGGALPTNLIARRVIASTVTLVTFDAGDDTLAQGSGFSVSPGGRIVTNWHVVSDARRVVAVLSTGRVEEHVDFIAGDATLDIAVLQLAKARPPSLVLSDSIPEIGSHVVAVGSPLGLSRTVSDGIVSAIRTVEGADFVQTTAAISPGSSGGPLVDDHARAFAITTATIRSGQSLNFAVPIRAVRALLRSAARPTAIALATPRGTAPPAIRTGIGPISQYTGMVTNSGLPDWPATLDLIFAGWNPSPHGYVSIGAPLGGSGPMTAGWLSDSFAVISVSPSNDTILWVGGVVGDSIDGTYRILGGEYRGQSGTWRVHRIAGQPIPSRLRSTKH